MHMRIPIDLYKVIVIKENYSEWARQAMVEKLLRENDGALIDLQIKKLENEIKELKIKKQGAPEVDGSAYEKLVEEAREWEHKNPGLNSESHRQFVKVKEVFYPRLKVLPQGRGATVDVIRKFIADFEKDV